MSQRDVSQLSAERWLEGTREGLSPIVASPIPSDAGATFEAESRTVFDRLAATHYAQCLSKPCPEMRIRWNRRSASSHRCRLRPDWEFARDSVPAVPMSPRHVLRVTCSRGRRID